MCGSRYNGADCGKCFCLGDEAMGIKTFSGFLPLDSSLGLSLIKVTFLAFGK